MLSSIHFYGKAQAAVCLFAVMQNDLPQWDSVW